MSLPFFCACHSTDLCAMEKGGFNVCLYLAFPLSLHLSYRKVRRGGSLDICLYLALPLSLHSSYGKVKRGGGFNICLHLALPLSVILWQGEKGGLNICLYLCFPSLTPFILLQGEKGEWV